MEQQALPHAKYATPIFGALVATMPRLCAQATPLPPLEAQTSPIAAASLAINPCLLLLAQLVWHVSSVQPTNSARAALPPPAEPIPWRRLALFQLIIAPAMLAFILPILLPLALFAQWIPTVLEAAAVWHASPMQAPEARTSRAHPLPVPAMQAISKMPLYVKAVLPTATALVAQA